MRWVITKDLINADDEKGRHWVGYGTNMDLRERVKAMPLGYAEQYVAGFIAGRELQAGTTAPISVLYPYEFRLLDGDNEVYYEGRCGDITDAPENKAFAPQDWAEGTDGVTTTEFRKVGEEGWETL